MPIEFVSLIETCALLFSSIEHFSPYYCTVFYIYASLELFDYLAAFICIFAMRKFSVLIALNSQAG